MLDIISFLEENYLNNIDYLLDPTNGYMKTNGTIKELQEWESNSNNTNKPENENKNEGEIILKNQNTLKKENTDILSHHIDRKPESFIFTHIKFIVQRRLYSPSIVYSQFSSLPENEILILFEQIKHHFIKQ